MESNNKPFENFNVFITLYMPVLKDQGDLNYNVDNYREFLNNLDIGITVIDGCPSGLSLGAKLVVTDSEKWFLAKIKYGF